MLYYEYHTNDWPPGGHKCRAPGIKAPGDTLSSGFRRPTSSKHTYYSNISLVWIQCIAKNVLMIYEIMLYYVYHTNRRISSFVPWRLEPRGDIIFHILKVDAWNKFKIIIQILKNYSSKIFLQIFLKISYTILLLFEIFIKWEVFF